MELAVRQEDADVLLKQKNVLDETVLDKYRTAGQIVQTGLKYIISLINESYHLQKSDQPISVQELCILGDSFLINLLSKVYNNQIKEKGISYPTSIEVNELAYGFSPELDDEGQYFFTAGDVVTISLGVQIDGYTSQVSHTLVIYPPGIELNSEIKPEGPLLGSKADAICASHIATETLMGLLGLSLTPEKLPIALKNEGGISGRLLRNIVDSIAESFGCIVLPGSKIRRIRRFLAGQAEGIVAERDFKGVVWDESHQEERLLNKAPQSQELILSDSKSNIKPSGTNNSSAIPSDEFIVLPGEVYQIDIRISSLNDFNEVGLITLEEIDHFTGKNNKQEFNSKSTIHIRDFAINHQLKLRTSRKLLSEIDNQFSVYPFKLSYTSKHFPIDLSKDLTEQFNDIKQDLKTFKLGLSELNNRHLIKSRPIQLTKFVPLEQILISANPTGKHGIDMNKPVLPGMEIPLPQLGVSSLKLKSLLNKHGKSVTNVRESITVVINNVNNGEIIRLTGGSKSSSPSWVHSQYQLKGAYVEAINQIGQLLQDKRFGIKVKEIYPYKLNQDKSVETSMQLD
ncbi:putative metalloprotease [Scheffersomyces coipomensis]|uniref:putative metalloprotease n=1 Tax=Scheffersomyces coipomensis TaxID=1788519 RepID=UPI00315D34E8